MEGEECRKGEEWDVMKRTVASQGTTRPGLNERSQRRADGMVDEVEGVVELVVTA
jgi:hypothetical protein